MFTRSILAAAMVGLSVGASAQTADIGWTANLGYLDITLTNTSTPLTGVQAPLLLTGVSFTVASGPADLTGSTVTYQFGDVISWEGGTKTLAGPGGEPGAAWAWGPPVAGYPNYLNALNGSVGTGGPDFGIINSSATSVGASLATGSHNLMYEGTVIFRIANPGIGAGTTLGNVQPLFNTVPPLPVPEPGTYAMLLAGLGVVGFLARRRRPV